MQIDMATKTEKTLDKKLTLAEKQILQLEEALKLKDEKLK